MPPKASSASSPCSAARRSLAPVSFCSDRRHAASFALPRPSRASDGDVETPAGDVLPREPTEVDRATGAERPDEQLPSSDRERHAADVRSLTRMRRQTRATATLVSCHANRSVRCVSSASPKSVGSRRAANRRISDVALARYDARQPAASPASRRRRSTACDLHATRPRSCPSPLARRRCPPNTGDKLRASNTLNARQLHPLVRRLATSSLGRQREQLHAAMRSDAAADARRQLQSRQPLPPSPKHELPYG